jgi:hypothetical protein
MRLEKPASTASLGANRRYGNVFEPLFAGQFQQRVDDARARIASRATAFGGCGWFLVLGHETSSLAVSSNVGAGGGSAKQKQASGVMRSFQQAALSPLAGMANARRSSFHQAMGCAFRSPTKRYQSLAMQICPHPSAGRTKCLSRCKFAFPEAVSILFLKNMIVEKLFL